MPYFIERIGRADLSGMAQDPAAAEVLEDYYVAHLENFYRVVRSCSAATRRLIFGLLIIDVGELSIPSLTRNLSVVRFASRCG